VILYLFLQLITAGELNGNEWGFMGEKINSQNLTVEKS
jgi:hypothetical protein